MSDLEQLVAEVQQEHRERMTVRGRKRVTRTPKVEKPPGFIFFCQHCESEFRKHKRGYKFCSRACQNAHRVRVSAEDLLRYVKQGATIERMNLKFKVSRDALRRSLRRHGLYRQWQAARYQKCRS